VLYKVTRPVLEMAVFGAESRFKVLCIFSVYTVNDCRPYTLFYIVLMPSCIVYVFFFYLLQLMHNNN